ncbi:condensation domain-containing protein, partial [Pseudoalteromonas maricaloris]|uniref:condensation domain-containing protein n=1 Tax=Pseudoalteromonas maricaloris TaxID=184924 RepID=UPI0032119EB7
MNYADYAQWQRNTLNTSALETHRRFWFAYLEDAPPLHQLPLDRARTRMAVAQGGTHITHLDNAVCEQVQAQCRRHDVTLFTWLQTAFAVFVGKYSHTTDVVIGAPFSGREHSQLQPLV